MHSTNLPEADPEVAMAKKKTIPSWKKLRTAEQYAGKSRLSITCTKRGGRLSAVAILEH